MRVAVVSLLLLTACGPQTADKATLAAVEAEQKRAAAEDDAVPCALPGQQMRRDCLVERTQGEGDGLILTIRHPDGAFRRLLVARDGRGVVAADGAEPATFTVIGENRIEVTIAGERYQLPATIKGGGAGQ
jgi:hypothetical protein